MHNVILLLTCSTLAWGALAFGGVYEWARQPLMAMAATAGCCAWVKGRSKPMSKALTISAAATIFAVLLQLIPVDGAVLKRISPATDSLLRQADLVYSGSIAAGTPVAHAISISPMMTARSLLLLVCAVALTFGTARWLTRPRLRSLATVIALIGLALSLTGIVQRAVSPGLIYGFWRPLQGTDPFGPFVNKNHFAGWLLMGLPVVIGLAAGQAVRTERLAARDWRDWLLRLSEVEGASALIALFIALVMMLALLLTFSRSGITSAAIALSITVILMQRASRKWSHLGALTVVVLATLAVVWVGVEPITARFEALDGVNYEARAVMRRDALKVFQDFPISGIGIGTYSVASLKYQTGLPEWHVTAAHNDWLQLLAEGGLLVTLPVFCLLSALALEVYRRFQEHRNSADRGTTYFIRVGAVVGLIAIGSQSLVEFSLQMPGNSMMFAVLLSIAIAPMERWKPNA